MSDAKFGPSKYLEKIQFQFLESLLFNQNISIRVADHVVISDRVLVHRNGKVITDKVPTFPT